MIDNTKYIADYISGNLSQEEMEQFEFKKENERTLENEFQIVLKSREFLKARSMIEEIENDPDLPHADAIVQEYFANEEAEERQRSRIRKGLLMSLPIAATLTGFILLLYTFQNTDPLSRLYTHYYSPLQTDEIQNIIVRVETNQLLAEGVQYYVDGKYSKAIEKLLQVGDSSYILGISYMGNKNLLQAQIHLGEFYLSNPNHTGVNWYLGLIHLKLSNTEKATEHFQRLFLIQNPYQTSAARILRKLEKYNEARGN